MVGYFRARVGIDRIARALQAARERISPLDRGAIVGVFPNADRHELGIAFVELELAHFGFHLIRAPRDLDADGLAQMLDLVSARGVVASASSFSQDEGELTELAMRLEIVCRDPSVPAGGAPSEEAAVGRAVSASRPVAIYQSQRS